MTLKIGDTAPDFQAHTTEGPIRFHDWIGDSSALLFSHPTDVRLVCTTELGSPAKIRLEFGDWNVKIIGLSVDSIDDHAKWVKDIEETQGPALNYPIIGDDDYAVSVLYGMLPAETSSVIISGSVSEAEARELFGEWQAPRRFIRSVPQPGRGGPRAPGLERAVAGTR